ncbi:PREDICTED: probable ubiquitin-conjugating enzyme E2 21 isoform X2 [Camelina sativa]|uniref:Probable ubiquitin-conjugating enzyme E2 21 isoform X2 n=1 Tax=Camelina sativa TaxID=90675 RepID=A0ABM0ZLM2_CAMSA|nr:PREDICTED: probable ubiquitin-conjugating enzyme E2 21 isoform X2 [Camelina sativa]
MAKHEGRTFQIDITMPEGYPFEPPKMQFSTKVWLKNLEFMSKHGPYALETEQPSVRSILVQIKLTMGTGQWAICIYYDARN